MMDSSSLGGGNNASGNNNINSNASNTSVTSRERIRLKCRYEGDIRTVIVYPHSSFQELKKRLSGDFGFEVSLKYEDHEGDLITLSSQNDLNDLFLYENTDTLNVLVSEAVSLPQLTLKTVGKQHSGSNLLQVPTPAASKDWSRGNLGNLSTSGLGTPSQSMVLPRFTPTNRFPSINDRFTEVTGIRWKKGEMLGQGAFGVVYLGLNIDTGELMAVKQMATEEVSKRELSSLENEINLLRTLRHPNIVRYSGTELTPMALSIFLEYVPGGSLKALIDKFGSLEESVAKSYTRQLLLGLEYLHRNGIAHRDIKGANCLVGNDGVIKLADFGNSKHWHPVANATGNAINATQTGDIKGTPAWMAPEVVKEQGNIAWRKADIWSLACTTLEMTTGKPPWSQFNNSVTILYHLACQDTKPEYPYPSSTELLTFLNICFQRDASHRPDVTSLLLHPFVNGSSSAAAANGGWAVRPTTMSSLMQNDWESNNSSSAFRSSLHGQRRPLDMPANVRQISTDSQQSTSSFPNISNSRSNSVTTIPLLNVPTEPNGILAADSTAYTGRMRLYSISSNPDQSDSRLPVPGDSITPRVMDSMAARDFSTPRTQQLQQFQQQQLQQQRLLQQYDLAAASSQQHHSTANVSNSLAIHVDPELTHEAADNPSPVDQDYLSDYTAATDSNIARKPLALKANSRDHAELGPPSNSLDPIIPLPNELSAASTPGKPASGRKKATKNKVQNRRSISKSEKRQSVGVISDLELPIPSMTTVLASPAKVRSAKGMSAKKGNHASANNLELNAIMNHARQKAATPLANELPADDSSSQVSNVKLPQKQQSYYDSEDATSDWPGNDGDNESLGDIEDEVGSLATALEKEEALQHIPEEEEAIRYHNLAMESPRNMVKTAIPYRHESDAVVEEAMYNRVTTADGIITWDEYLQHHPRHHEHGGSHHVHHGHLHHGSNVHLSPPDMKLASSSTSPSKALDDSNMAAVEIQTQKKMKDMRIGGESLTLGRQSRKGNKDRALAVETGPPSPVNGKKNKSGRRERREAAADNDVLDISCDSLESLQIAGVHMVGLSGPRTFSRNNNEVPSAPSTSYGKKQAVANSFPDAYDDSVYIANDDSALEQQRRHDEPLAKSLSSVEPMMLEGHLASVTRLRAPKKTDLLISSSMDGTLRIWGANDATSKVVLDASTFNSASMRESTDNRPERRVTLGSKNVDLDGSSDLTELLGRTVKVTNIWSEENCDSIWAACSDGSVRVWNGGEYKPLRLLKGHEEAITCIEGMDAHSYSSTIVATGSVDRTIRTWDLRAKKHQVFVFRGHGDNVMTLRWCEGGRALISGGKDKTIKIWDTRAGRLRTTIEKHFGSVHALRVLSDFESSNPNLASTKSGAESASFVSAGRDSMINFWSASGDCLSSHSAHRGHVSYLSELNFNMTRRPVSANYAAPLMLSCGSDNVIKLWDMRKCKCVTDVTANISNNVLTGNISKMVWCGNSFVSCSTSGQIRLYERAVSSLEDVNGMNKAGDWTAQDLLSHSNACTDLVSSDSLVACASRSGRIIRWNL